MKKDGVARRCEGVSDDIEEGGEDDKLLTASLPACTMVDESDGGLDCSLGFVW